MKINYRKIAIWAATSLGQGALIWVIAYHGAKIALNEFKKDPAFTVIAERAAESVLEEFKKNHAVIVIQENDAAYLTKKVRVTWPNEKTGG